MASKASSSAALFLTLILLLFAFTSAQHRNNCPCSGRGSGGSSGGGVIIGGGGGNNGSRGGVGGGSGGGGSGGGGAGRQRCPRDTLKLRVCANLLNGLLNLVIGKPPTQPCCSLLSGLIDLDAAVCLCTALRANVLGIVNLNVPLSLSLLVNSCGRTMPANFICR